MFTSTNGSARPCTIARTAIAVYGPMPNRCSRAARESGIAPPRDPGRSRALEEELRDDDLVGGSFGLAPGEGAPV